MIRVTLKPGVTVLLNPHRIMYIQDNRDQHKRPYFNPAPPGGHLVSSEEMGQIAHHSIISYQSQHQYVPDTFSCMETPDQLQAMMLEACRVVTAYELPPATKCLGCGSTKLDVIARNGVVSEWICRQCGTKGTPP